MQATYDVFISYSRLNQGFADDLYRALSPVGIRVSMNREYSAINEGQTEEALDRSRAMILVVSSPSMKASNLQLEVADAFERGLPILPVQIQELKPNAVLPPGLKKLPWIDAKGNQPQSKLDEIVAATRQMLNAIPALSAEKQTSVVPTVPPVETAAASAFDIFLSHSSKDKAQADLLWKALEKRGRKCWIAPHSIRPAELWDEAIRRGVKESSLVVLLFSAHSDASSEVKTELYFAKKFGVPLVPVRIEDIEAEKLESFIWDKQWISAINPPLEDQLLGVVGQIESVFTQNQNSKTPRPVVEEVDVPIPTTHQIEAEIEAAIPVVLPLPTSQVGTLQHILTSRGRREGRLFGAVREGATDVGATDRFGQTALHYAVRESQPDVVRLLIERGADLNARDQEGTTPLHLAVENVDLARLLLLKGADFEVQDKMHRTPLSRALESKKTQTIHLLELFADVKRGARTPNEALQEAFLLQRWQSERILNSIAAGADDVLAMKMRDAAGRTALHWAAWKNEPELVELLLQKGADSDARDNAGNTPTKLAHNKGNVEVEETLRAWESRPTSKTLVRVPTQTLPSRAEANAQLQAALGSQGRYKAEAIMRAIQNGATDFSFTDQAGRTALHWAAKEGNTTAMRIALEHGADVNAISDEGITPLAWATVSISSPGILSMVEKLLKEHGARR